MRVSIPPALLLPRVWVPAAFAGVVLLLLLLFTLFGGDETSATSAARPAPLPSSGIAITPDAARAAGITTQVAGPATIETTVTLYGSIKPNAEREQELRARYPGIVRLVSKRAGDPVSAGETLVTVEANESLQTYGIRSPIAGRVLERSANPGESVGSDTILMKIVDLKTVWAEFAVFARDLARVRPGQAVHINGSDSSAALDTTLTYVAPSGSTDSQSVVARAVLDNSAAQWIAGQFATADVVISQVEAAVAVAPAAIQVIGGKQVVFVVTDTGFEPREVKVGQRSRTAVEILEGIAAGESYAATNSYLIKADLSKGEAEED
ncbi:MAG: efflux RND transporter periplasmic adaptor subunit [Alphaproteobacteria bacterium]|nr:efflux RND transporter periplasmic adaptor subunit [Reyranella sp.]MBL6940065.1 efflux RND transporter periplasmic adaptor subunit [Alphaproteobacteria bacterium]MBL7100152.1 efflux RND transporter periplasmic adaptor subunit [Alphaproteobacteria bacterium]